MASSGVQAVPCARTHLQGVDEQDRRGAIPRKVMLPWKLARSSVIPGNRSGCLSLRGQASTSKVARHGGPESLEYLLGDRLSRSRLFREFGILTCLPPSTARVFYRQGTRLQETSARPGIDWSILPAMPDKPPTIDGLGSTGRGQVKGRLVNIRQQRSSVVSAPAPFDRADSSFLGTH